MVERLAPPAVPGHFDELRSGGARLSPEWAKFFGALEDEGLQDMDRRMRELARQVRDNGITYNVYAERDGIQRPWSVDLFPLMVDAAQWRRIEAGVLQRAGLLEALCQDIYGAQQLLRHNLLPAALVHGHPGYLRGMRDMGGAAQHGGGRHAVKHLHVVAFDLARGPDGNWFIVSQRTESPSGLGYLLENRALIARQFPQAHEAAGVRSLTDAYRPLLEHLKRLSPMGENAHIALLTPGPYTETWFEHAYLARQLGLTLAEGSDLTVRDQKLYLRTLRGLEPVHVLFKRLDDAFLDPLELRADSTLGVPGLLQAVRAGNVVMANRPGSGFLESPALLGFLPALAEQLLGEPLLLPALDTWWCGEHAAMQAVLPRLAQGVVKPTYPGAFEPVLLRSLNHAVREQWAARIQASPAEHTVQSYLPLGQMPTWDSSIGQGDPAAIVPRSYKLRVFALANGPRSWYVLPGGLVRIAPTHSDIASMQRGGSSADLWVKSDGQAALPLPLAGRGAATAAIAARKRLVTSRAAENLFWLGRYTERSDNSVRLARLCLQSVDAEVPSSRATWEWLESLARRQGLVPAGPRTAVGRFEPKGELLYLAPQGRRRLFGRALVLGLDEQREHTSVGFNLRALKAAASTVRERLSVEQWNTIAACVDDFERDCRDARQRHDTASMQALAALSRASVSLAAITGAQTDRMTRDDGWQLLAIGRYLERLGFLAQVLEQAAHGRILENADEDGSGFAALLALFDSTITYQAQHQQSRELSALFDLLVMDDENPRAIAWVARSLRARLAKLARLSAGQQDALMKDVPDLSQWTLASLCGANESGLLMPLATAMSACSSAAWRISDAISARHFTHTLESSIES